jgi:hypothetical protein
MSSLLGNEQSHCDRFQEWLEDSQTSQSALQSYEILLDEAPAEHRAHAEICSDCRDAAADMVSLRNLLREAWDAPVAGPWFAPRVMATITAQEAELSRESSRGMAIWLAVPRFASRLSWVAAALLICTCTWLYERPVAAPPAQTAAAFATEHLFDPPPAPPNHDDVLVSLNEKDQ